MKNKKLIILYGPTSVGKTDTVLALANKHDIEIINGDIGQFYEPLSIGTAKPDWKNEPVPHHLFDVIKEPTDSTVVRYKEQILKTVQEVWERRKLPVIVGGSGFYLKSLFFSPKSPSTQDCSGDSTTQNPESSTQELWQELKKRDPERAEALYQQDRYRIERALALLNQGIQASDCQPEYQALDADVLLLFLNRERKALYDRINKRTHMMIDGGWLQEVEPLLATEWEPFLMRKKLIGYNDIITYLHGDRTEQEKVQLIATIQKKTRNYAKRQLTFWRMLEKLMNQHFTDPSRALEIDASDTGNVDDVVEKFLK